MKRLFLWWLAGASLAFGQGIDGLWQGTLETGAAKLRIVVEITRSGDTLSGKLQSPDQSPAWLPVDTATFSGGVLKLELKRILSTYEGKLDKDTITGEWRQMESKFPLALRRVERKPEAPAAKGPSLTPDERKFLTDHLSRTRGLFFKEVGGLSEAQWKFKPTPDRWSIAEIAEHLVLSEESLFKRTTENVLKLPPRRDAPRNGRAQDTELIARMEDRSKKASAVDELKPTGRWPSRAQVAARFLQARDETARFASTTDQDLRAYSTPHPVTKYMDAYEYLLVISAHTERHLAQMREVKADVGYPKAEPFALAPVTGFSDKGTFVIYKDEERLGDTIFDWQADGSYESVFTLAMAGQKIVSKTKLVMGRDGQWTRIVVDGPQGQVIAAREDDLVLRTFKDKSALELLKSGSRLFDNYGPALIAQTVKLYDQAKGGKQEFPLVILPGVPMQASFERKDDVERPIGGKDVKFARYIYHLPGVDGTVWVDPSGKVCLFDVPQQHAAFVREGYEALRKAPETGEKISQPKYDVTVDRNTRVPMRDGIKLATDIYRPAGDGKFPAILVRTPYKKEMAEVQARYYARRGYAFAVQDCRGRFASPGTWEPFVNEPKDGYDAVEWLAKQPWSTGKVGMIGGSYVGWVQWWAASQKPPHLVTIIPNVAPPDPFYNIPYEYGVFFVYGAIWWADVLESNATADLSGAAITKTLDRKFGKLLMHLPVIDLDRTILGKENPYWRTWIEHPTNDSYWERANFLDKLKDVRIPVFHQSGWFDGDGIGTKLNYLKMASYGHTNQKLVLGPWGHTDTAMRRIGERDFGEQAIIDLQRDYLRWFDYWLKGVDNGITKEPLVRIFVMGSNKWLTGEKYPLPETKFRKLYLASGGKANTSKGDGKLTFDLPAGNVPADRYVYDPGDPTPDPRFYEEPEEEEKKVKSAEERKEEAQNWYRKQSETRRDILVYQTEPLEKPLTFAGPISAVLYASSSAKDTDWFVHLAEVDKDGKMFPLAHGKIRARFRKSMSKPELLMPGEVYEYTLDLWHTGITIEAGRRLRVEIASAAFPLFSRNLNTGGNNEVETKFVSADQTIFHDQRRPSHLLLPVIE